MRRLPLVALALAAACGTDSGGAPQPGTLNLTLASGGTNDGAIVVLVSGGPVLSADGPAGYQVASNTDDRGTHVMIIGSLTNGVLATLNVADVSRASAYVVTVEQVADRNTFALLDPARDQVTVGSAK
jgi:hypothetical protein